MVVVRRLWWGWVGAVSAIAVAGGLSQAAIAQTHSESNSASPHATHLAQAEAPSTQAADLIIPARVGVGYSTSGGGYDGFGSFDGFIPLQQTPGKDLLYLVGRLLVDNDANLGGNLLVGYRFYSPGARRIYGTYLSYDTRDTGNSLFSQLGFGFETLGNGWDARLNAYFPVGDSRRTVGESTFDTGIQPDRVRFQDHFLLVSGVRQQQVIQDIEAAMVGFDAEVGGRLLQFGSAGVLRGYGGLYYLSAGESTLGVRGRLEARSSDFLSFGLTVQHDSIFGTNVFGTIALSFPSIRSAGGGSQSVLARLGEVPYRINAIAVDNQREVKTLSSSVSDQPAINPATGQPYLFQHVRLGAGGGDGSFENPFGQLQSGLNATRSDGNDIIYIQAGTNPGIPAFTIPNGVQVLSTSSTQLINTAQLGSVPLPLSGNGVLPSVTGTVTMGSDTVLAGFSITSSTGAGVTFANVNRVEVRDNVIANTADSGILGNGVGEATLLRNQIRAVQNQGIFLQNVGTVTIADNTVTDTIGGTTPIANPITGNITIGPITIPNPGSIIPLPSGQGIVVASVSRASIQGNTISGTATQGIVVLDATNASVTDNSVTDTIGKDFTVTVPTLGNIPLPTGQGIVIAGAGGTAEVSRNRVTTVQGQGIAVAGAEDAIVTNNVVQSTVDQGMVIAGTTGTTTIASNQIREVATRNVTVANPTGIGPALITIPTGQGVLLLNPIGTVSLTGNTIEGVRGAFSPTPPAPDSGQGIALANFAGSLNLTIADNQVRGNFNDGILLGFAGRTSATTTPATATITITGNTLESNGGNAPVRGDGIGIGLEQDARVNGLLIENNTIRNNGDEGIDIRLGLLAVPILNPTTAQFTGTIRSNTLSGNGQNGIQLAVRGGSQANLTIDRNTLSNNGLRGVDLGTSSAFLLGTPRLAATVRLNEISVTPGNPSVQAQTSASAGAAQVACVNLTQNRVNGNTTFTNAANVPANTFSIVGTTNTIAADNTYLSGATPSFTGTFTNVAACP